MEIKPYGKTNSSKKAEVEEMFDNISKRYDFLNRLLSAGVDVGWRKKVVKKLLAAKPSDVLDVATGTGDLALAISQRTEAKIVGFDLSAGMLDIGRQKVAQQQKSAQIQMVQGDAENMPFEDDSFDCVTVAFGVRNFENLEAGLAEIKRVLRPGGKVLILEFSQPQKFPFRQIYFFYFRFILPTIGRLVSKDPRAYTYLPDSVRAFPYGDRFNQILKKVGFNKVNDTKLTFGIASLYEASK